MLRVGLHSQKHAKPSTYLVGTEDLLKDKNQN